MRTHITRGVMKSRDGIPARGDTVAIPKLLIITMNSIHDVPKDSCKCHKICNRSRYQ